jgi:hypothetical protein
MLRGSVVVGDIAAVGYVQFSVGVINDEMSCVIANSEKPVPATSRMIVRPVMKYANANRFSFIEASQ